MSRPRTLHDWRVSEVGIAEHPRVTDEELAELREAAALPTKDLDTALAADIVLDLIDARAALATSRVLRGQPTADAEGRRQATTFNALRAKFEAAEERRAELERLLVAVEQPHRAECPWTLRRCSCGQADAVELAAHACHHAPGAQ
jgi:hypothetical protein